MLEDSAVKWHSKDDLVTWNAVLDISVNDGVGIEGSAGWAGDGMINIGEVACIFIPGSCEIVRLVIVSMVLCKEHILSKASFFVVTTYVWENNTRGSLRAEKVLSRMSCV